MKLSIYAFMLVCFGPGHLGLGDWCIFIINLYIVWLDKQRLVDHICIHHVLNPESHIFHSGSNIHLKLELYYL